MLHTTESFTNLYPSVKLISYIHEPSAELAIPARRAVIVCPGGGYVMRSDREAEPIALQFFAAGFNVFTLCYSVGNDAADYAPLTQAALAVKYVRENAERFYVDPAYVFMIGFSAGGHLAASCGTLWKHPRVLAALGDTAAAGIGRPTGTILCYPVLTAGEHTHKGSIQMLCGTEAPTKEECERFSLELHVDSTTAPAFIWHTFDDPCVPVENALLYATALRKNGVPFELHIYPHGTHGLALCNRETWANIPDMIAPVPAEWLSNAIRWAKDFSC